MLERKKKSSQEGSVYFLQTLIVCHSHTHTHTWLVISPLNVFLQACFCFFACALWLSTGVCVCAVLAGECKSVSHPCRTLSKSPLILSFAPPLLECSAAWRTGNGVQAARSCGWLVMVSGHNPLINFLLSCLSLQSLDETFFLTVTAHRRLCKYVPCLSVPSFEWVIFASLLRHIHEPLHFPLSSVLHYWCHSCSVTQLLRGGETRED